MGGATKKVTGPLFQLMGWVVVSLLVTVVTLMMGVAGWLVGFRSTGNQPVMGSFHSRPSFGSVPSD